MIPISLLTYFSITLTGNDLTEHTSINVVPFLSLGDISLINVLKFLIGTAIKTTRSSSTLSRLQKFTFDVE